MKTLQLGVHHLHSILHQPLKVLWICGAFIGMSLLLNGSLLRLYGLHRDEGRLRQQTALIQSQVSDLDRQLKIAQDPAFIERQALDRYDLVEENDLVFVFADE